MKVVSTEALTKLIQLVKSAFVKVEDVIETEEVTLADVALSGDYDDLSNKPDLNGKADTDLSNLNTQGKNIANWSTNVSNCITEIPQDIKLELNNGTLTLKAGSKVYVPNGPGVFNAVTIDSDKYLSPTGLNRQDMFCFRPNGNSFNYNNPYKFYSGSVAPSDSRYMTWYDTDNNLVKVTSDGGSTWTGGYSLPLGLFTSTSQIISIDQVFNSFGYIGSTVFALPGVKGLIPNGRNADGSLKSVEFLTDRVLLSTNTYSYNGFLAINSNNFDASSYTNYNEKDNYYYNDSEAVINRCICGTFEKGTGGIVTSFIPKTVFHAADYNDINNIPHIVETYNNGTSWYRVYSDGWCEQGGITGTGVVSINLLVNFIDLNYIVLANVLSDDTQQAYSNQVNIKTKTTNSFIFAAASTRIRQWRACGYIS